MSLGDFKGNTLKDVMFHSSEGQALNTFESTCSFPLGIPPEATVLYSETRDLGLTPLYEGSTWFGGTAEIESVALDMFFDKNPDLVEGDGSPARRPYGYQPTELRNVSIALNLGSPIGVPSSPITFRLDPHASQSPKCPARTEGPFRSCSRNTRSRKRKVTRPG